ncbi:MAG: lytic transglycosylase domain-containing protein, partial [Pseudomonadota bacterium]
MLQAAVFGDIVTVNMKKYLGISKFKALFAAIAVASSLFAWDFAFAGEVAANPASDNLVEGAKLCTSYLPRQERQYGIPVHLLAAIASTESGRYHRELGINLPWPWTINVEGKGYFFNTKQEAITAVQSFQSRGIKSIDVGCMQVNLHHHPDAFANLDQAFDPAYNVAYGAKFLRDNFSEGGSWRKAAAYYHSHTPIFGEQYASMVFNAWSKIINKVADARAGRLILQAADANPPVKYAAAPAKSSISHKPVYRSLRLNSISVATDTTRENGVLVVRPHYGEQPKTTEVADNNFVTRPNSGPNARSNVRIENTKTGLQETNSDANKGAKIIKVGSGSTKPGQFQASVRIAKVNASATGLKQNSTFV